MSGEIVNFFDWAENLFWVCDVLSKHIVSQDIVADMCTNVLGDFR